MGKETQLSRPEVASVVAKISDATFDFQKKFFRTIRLPQLGLT
jgi:hypothetical protein